MKDWPTGKKVSFAVLLFIAAIGILAHLQGCTTEPPTPFVTGAEVQAPYGCIDYRTRGGSC